MFPVIDAHCDTLFMRALVPEVVPCVTEQTLRQGGVALQVMALFAGIHGAAGEPYEKALAQLAVFEDLKGKGLRQVRDLSQMPAQGPCAMLSIEGGEVFAGDPANVEFFFQKGVRMAAITWNHENELAYPAKGEEAKGIKPMGWEMLSEMARFSIAADVSHLHARGFWDLVEKHVQPPMASHSNCAALCPHFRNLTDDQIKALCGRGGWIGINFYPDFLNRRGEADVSDIVRHVDHIAQMGFAEHVGFGSDFDGIEKAPEDVQSPADFPVVLEALRKRGYDEKALRGIAGENFLRYYQRL